MEPTPSPDYTLSPQPIVLNKLTEDVAEILGRPLFLCATIATLLRHDGAQIAEKAEAEQAAVIFWFLGLHAKHGPDNWKKVANDKLNELKGRVLAAREAQKQTQ
jgi:hypothetical protein